MIDNIPIGKEKSPLSKKISQRIAVVYKILTGDKTVKQAAKELGLSESYVRVLKTRLHKQDQNALLKLWTGEKIYSFNAYKNDYFIRNILPNIHLNKEEIRKLETFAKLMYRGVIDPRSEELPIDEFRGIKISMAAERLKLKEREIYKIQRKAFTEGFWRILSRERQRYLLKTYPELATACTPQEFSTVGFDITRTEEENYIRDLEYERLGDKKTVLKTSKKKNIYPKTRHYPKAKKVIVPLDDNTGMDSDKIHEKKYDCTLYKRSKVSTSKVNAPKEKESKEISFNSFSDREGKLKPLTTCIEKPKAAIYKTEEESLKTDVRKQEDDNIRQEDFATYAEYIKALTAKANREGWGFSLGDFATYAKYAEALVVRAEQEEGYKTRAAIGRALQTSRGIVPPVVVLDSRVEEPIAGRVEDGGSNHVLECTDKEFFNNQWWSRVKDSSFLDVILCRRDPRENINGKLFQEVDISTGAKVNCSACGFKDYYLAMSRHKHVANVILCSHCKALLRGKHYITLRDMLAKIHERVPCSPKKPWIKWASHVRSYIVFMDLPPFSNDFTLQPHDKAFDASNYYNPYMADIVAEGKLLKAKKDIAEREQQQLEAIENQKKSEIAEKEKQEHCRTYKQKIAEGRLPIEISFEIYMQMLPEIEREDRARERQRMKAEREAELIKNDPVYAAEVMAKEKALLAESDAMLRELYESEKAHAGY